MSTVTRIKCKTDNCYLVANGKDAFLVDTGSAIGYDQVLAECSKYNMKLIVLTHTHFDHAENAVELFESYDKQPMESYGIVGKVVLDTSLKVLKETPVEKPENLIFVKEGDDLSAYGFDAKIIGLPGHTKGSIGVDVEGKDLIVGDELDNWISPATGHLYNDLDAIKKSADKITALGERTIYYGHGKPTKNKFKKI